MKRLKKIYSLEDDSEVSRLIEEALKNAGFLVKCFTDYRLFFDEVRKEKPDLVLLDLVLSTISGEEVLKYIKGNLSLHNIPIIVLSGKVEANVVSNSLDIGADDFIIKPFNLIELVSRINAVLRRFGLRNNIIYRNMEIVIDKRMIKINDEVVDLTYKEFELLLYLLERSNMIVTREELIKKFWNDSTTNSRSMDMHIMALRHKVFSRVDLEIHTLLKVGYKLTFKE